MRITVEIVSVTQAAEELQISDTRVRVLIKDGKLPAQQVGREWAILRPNLEWFRKLDRPPGRPAK